MNTRRRGSVVTEWKTGCPTSFARSGSSEDESNAPLMNGSTADRRVEVVAHLLDHLFVNGIDLLVLQRALR